jgi:UDP-N-acetylmuramoyl-tripeptide--D-alanyl-D-alanine ligase
MKNWLSRYHPKYVRSLVYLLQSCEYDIRDYVKWHWRVKNFNQVEQRKVLVKTNKARLIYGLAWLILIAVYVLAVSVLWLEIGLIKYFIFAAIILASPYILAYGLIIPLVLVKILIQWPIEKIIIKRAGQKLKKHKAFKIAIAGSFGKTSFRELLKTVLAENKKAVAPPHSYNTPLSISRFILSLNGDEDVIIFELGEYRPGDIQKLCFLTQPELGIITGVNEAHLEKFKNLDQTAKTIFELADWLKDKPLYINGESDLAKKKALPSHIMYNREGVGKWKVINPHTDLGGTSFNLVSGNQQLNLKTKLLGLHQIGPLTAVVDIAQNLGLTLEQIKHGVGKTRPFDHRLEPKIDSQGVITLDDSYNGNPDGVKVIIEFLASLKGSRRLYVTPGLVEMGSRTKIIHQEIGIQLARAGIEKVILIRNSVTPFIAEGLENGNYQGELIWFDNSLEAFGALPHLTVKGDVVLLQNDWPDQYA